MPHECQRYETVGDWEWVDGVLTIRVSELSNWKREFLVAYHELFEAMWCKSEGISQKDVDAFDQAFEDKREPGNTDEPGDSPNAPYRHGHRIATVIEQLVAEELGENWANYDEEVCSLGE